jgi:hypothetical protein
MTATRSAVHSLRNKINNNIAYILVGALERRYFVTGGIGTFQSPNWTELNSQVVGLLAHLCLKSFLFFIILE